MSDTIKTSVIAHPPEMALAILREDYLNICDGKKAAALLLNVLEHWTNTIVIKQSLHWKDVWIFRSFEQLSSDMLNEYKRDALMEAVSFLEAKGFIVTKIPDKTTRRITHYHLEVGKVQRALDVAYPRDYGDTAIVGKTTMESRKNDDAQSENQRPIIEGNKDTKQIEPIPPTPFSDNPEEQDTKPNPLGRTKPDKANKKSQAGARGVGRKSNVEDSDRVLDELERTIGTSLLKWHIKTMPWSQEQVARLDRVRLQLQVACEDRAQQLTVQHVLDFINWYYTEHKDSNGVPWTLPGYDKIETYFTRWLDIAYAPPKPAPIDIEITYRSIQL